MNENLNKFTPLWLRAETKPGEKRTPLTPMAASHLIDKGATIYVESSSERVFSDEEYLNVGAKLVLSGTTSSLPKDTLVLGLKELPETPEVISSRHIYFAHAYKNQDGAQELLERFSKGDGKIYDLEYLVDSDGKRVSAFGHWAGYLGSALALWGYLLKEESVAPTSLESIRPWNSSEDLRKDLASITEGHRTPKVAIIGASGRSGKGATQFFNENDIEPVAFTREMTNKNSSIKELLDFDIIVNCALITEKRAPFLTREDLKKSSISIISDVSCDPGPLNPMPFYGRPTTFENPFMEVEDDIFLTAIDNLPGLLPQESSEDFSNQLLPHLEDLLRSNIQDSPWEKSLEYFFEKSYDLGVKSPDSGMLHIENPIINS